MRGRILPLIVSLLFCGVAAEAKEARPWFSLASHRTYSPSETAQIYLTYHDIEQLDFRVYKVRDPIKFFEQMQELHAFGPSSRPPQKKSRIEALHAWKQNTYMRVKTYVRAQLSHHTRKTVLQAFSGPGPQRREAVKGAQFTTAPFLNQAQLVQNWHESLPERPQTPYSYYNPLAVPLDLKEKGVFLVEAAHADLRAYTVLIITDLALVTKSAPGHMLVLAVDRNSGRPLEHCAVKVYSNRRPLASGRTDASGLYAVRQEKIEDALALAGVGADFAISDLPRYYFQDSDKLKSYIYTDRPVYRPGHKVYFKGILRGFTKGEYSLQLPDRLEVEVRDVDNKPVYKELLKVSEYGTLDGELTLSETAGLGLYSIVAHVGEQELRGDFRVEEYKKPEYEVKVATDKKFYIQGDTITAEISARYYFGEPVANATVQYQVHASRYYQWLDEGEYDDLYAESGEAAYDDAEGGVPYDNRQLSEEEGTLDAQGKLTVRIPIATEDRAADFRYRIIARVTDAARREIAGSTTVIVTRGAFFLTMSTDKYVYQPQEIAHINIRAMTFEEKPVAVPVDLEFSRVIWSGRNRTEQSIQRASAQTDAEGKGAYALPIHATGYFKIKAVARDAGGHTIMAEHFLYVTGRGFDDYYGRVSRQIEIVPDKKSYRVGDVAHLLVIFPMDNPYMLTTLEGRQMHEYWLRSMAGRSAVIDLPIRRNYAMDCFINVAFVKGGQLYTRSKSLNVIMDDQFLDVTVTPDKSEYKPRQPGEFLIAVKDKKGQPVRAELSVGLVDESVYAVRPEAAADIKKTFYAARRWNRVYTQFSVGYHFTGYSSKQAMSLATAKPSPSAAAFADFKPDSRMAEAKVRKLFPDTLFWNAHLVTDAAGRARVRVQYPDSLTTWRATVRAVTRDTKVGSVVSKTLTRKNLILRLQAPRFLTERDEVTISAIVHNYLSSEKTAAVSLDIQGAERVEGADKSVALAARGEARIDWRLKASTIGEVKLLGRALTDEESDAVEVTLPTIPHGLAMLAGRSGHITKPEETVVEKLTIPAQTNEQARSLRIDLAPSLASTLVGALDYLTSYPYGCVEQTMSSFLPNVVVAKTIQELKLNELKSAGDLPLKVRKGLERLYRFQHEDGGWGWWETDETNPFMTAYVIAGLSEAKSVGYAVDDSVIKRGRSSLQQQLKSGEKSIASDIRTYMIYALAGSGGVERSRLDEAYNGRKDLNNLGLALLALALSSSDKARALAVVEDLEKKGTVTDFDGYWDSRRQPMLDFQEDNTLEATAFAVKALSLLKPQSPVIGKAVRWLVTHRRFGYYWDSTKQTAIIISSLLPYLKLTNELEPDYRLQVFLNGVRIREQSVTAREAQNPDGISVLIGSGPVRNGDNEIKIVKSGSGNLYYSLSAKYYMTGEKIPAQGSDTLRVERSYFKLRAEKKSGQVVYREEPLSGPVVSGDTILVKLRISGKNAQYLMIEDPIPSGCEPIEQDALYELESKSAREYYDRRELRDQKVVFFSSYFRSGQHELYYLLKAQTPGTYNIMPTNVELMYQPEYRANSESHSLRVNDK